MADNRALYRPPEIIAGLDVGKTQDVSALMVMDREMRLLDGQLEPYFFIGWLEQFPLGLPYPQMVAQVRHRLAQIPKPTALVIDATGVGSAVVDLFRDGWTDYDPVLREVVPLEGKPTIIALTITAGGQAHNEAWDTWYVPKVDLINRLVVTLQQRRIQAAAELEHFRTLVKEAQQWEWKPTTKANDDPYLSWRTGAHDDLLLAVAVAVWWAEKYAPVSLPTVQGRSAYAIPTANPLMQRPRWPAGRR